MFRWLKRGNKLDQIQKDTKTGFSAVQKDISSISGWIKHLDSQTTSHNGDISGIKSLLEEMRQDINGLKNAFSMEQESQANTLFKTETPILGQETVVFSEEAPKKTPVQAPKMDKFSVTERSIIWILLNSDMKLSYEDLSSILGKEKSTIRGQINTIKQKDNDIISDFIEKNGKKRIYIDHKIKEKMLKNAKVRVNSKKNQEKEVKYQ